MMGAVVFAALFAAGSVVAQTGAIGDERGAGDGLLQDWGVSQSILQAKLYGFVEARFEKVADSPTGPGPDGRPAFVENPHAFDLPAFHFMMQALILERFRVFFNLAAPGAGSPGEDEELVVRNAWVEAPIVAPFLQLRLGKLYRRFGIYNEQLDAVPFFPGIEPPELFDPDHLMLTRTTNLMVHGSFSVGDGRIGYALHTGNDERESSQVPLGFDLRFEYSDVLLVGTSLYWSNGRAVPTREVGEGSPNGAVLNWMAHDRYVVFGAYAEVTLSGLLLQTEFWRSTHDARRDPEKVALLDRANLSPRQLERFGLMAGRDIVQDVEFDVVTAYVRMAYEFSIADETAPIPWTFTPYAQFDYYKNPETIREREFGGDDEAGVTDDGAFVKLTAGIILRPMPSVAFKLDGSGHLQKVAGESVFYPEIRASLAYYWEVSG